MTYVLRFLPEVEDDAITAFAKYIKNSGDACFGGSLTLFTSE